MNILMIGGGGREHALCWKLRQSDKCDILYCAPGNAGIAREAECVDLNPGDFDSIIEFVEEKGVELTIVGPEAPLVEGIVDRFNRTGLKIFGPTAEAARIEGDKAFAKKLMRDTGIPTADFTVHDSHSSALESPLLQKFPVVIKASGLAAGKGVIIADNMEDAEVALSDMFIRKKFGEAGSVVIIEEFLTGEEFSLFALADGDNYLMLPPSQDHKRWGEKDTGPNTGGMGAYAPALVADKDMLKKSERMIIMPLLAELRKRGTPYQGLLYCGLIVLEGEPKVLEFNCRFGDPETQCVLPLIEGDLVELCLAATEPGGIKRYLNEHPGQNIYNEGSYAVCVVAASGGYPGKYQKGFPISGLNKVYPDTVIFHAGTAEKDGSIITVGGRVLGVAGLGANFTSALDRAYSAISQIDFEGIYYRKDIGWRALRMMNDE